MSAASNIDGVSPSITIRTTGFGCSVSRGQASEARRGARARGGAGARRAPAPRPPRGTRRTGTNASAAPTSDARPSSVAVPPRVPPRLSAPRDERRRPERAAERAGRAAGRLVPLPEDEPDRDGGRGGERRAAGERAAQRAGRPRRRATCRGRRGSRSCTRPPSGQCRWLRQACSRWITASVNAAARAPSTTRWSKVTLTFPIGRTITSPSRTTGRGRDPVHAEDRPPRGG